MRQNLAVFVIVLVLMVACGWFVDRLLKAKALAECLESGRRNCVPLEIPQPPRR